MNKTNPITMRTLLRIFATLLALSFVLCTVCGAISFSYTVGSVYKSSYYYDAASELELTGDQRYDLVALAMSQLGYHSGDGDDEMHGENVLGTKSFAEYNRIYGETDNGQGNGLSYGYYWCCCFVSWCMRQVGISKNIVPTKCASRKIISALEDNGDYKKASSGYTPLCGDMIFFADADSTNATHIGFVIKVKDGVIYTVEGNGNNHTVARSYTVGDPYIIGFSCIDYETIDGMQYDFATAVNEEIYLPLLTLEDTKAFSKPGSDNELIYTFPAGERLEIKELRGCWARISTPNGDAWCDGDLCEQIVPDIDYAVKFYLNGGTGGALDQISYNGEDITLCDIAPIRTGYTFMGWADEPDGEVKYQPGDTFSGRDGLYRLFAVWKADTHTVKYLDANGDVLLEKQVSYGDDMPKANAPVKPADDEYTYKFRGWSSPVPPLVFGDVTFTPVYKAVEIAPETEPPATKAPETKAPETKAPATKAPETEPPVTKAPETKAPETTLAATEASPEPTLDNATSAPVEDGVTDAVPSETSVVTDTPTEGATNAPASTKANTTSADASESTDANADNGDAKPLSPAIIAVIAVAAVGIIAAAVILIVKKTKK